MTKGWIYGIMGGVAIAGAFAYIKVKSWVNSIEYGIQFEEFKLIKVGFDKIDFILPVWFYNPTPVNFILSDLNLKVFFDEYQVSTISTDQNYKLVAKKRSAYPLMISISTPQLLSFLEKKGLVFNDPNWMEKINISIIGSATIDAGLLRINNFPLNSRESLKYWTS